MAESYCWMKLKDVQADLVGPFARLAELATEPSGTSSNQYAFATIANVPTPPTPSPTASVGVLGQCPCCSPDSNGSTAWACRFADPAPSPLLGALANVSGATGWRLEGPSRRGQTNDPDHSLTLSKQFASRADALAWLASTATDEGVDWTNDAMGLWLIGHIT